MTIRKPKTGESLGDKKPKLASEWHPSKNEGLTPFDFSPKSGYKAWWKCPKGEDHEWPVKIAHRTDGSGCPFCSGRKPSSTNNLGVLNPKLSEEWHPTKNGTLTPFDFLPNSNKKVWWKCPKGEDHEWEATIAHRNNDKGCSICSGHKVVKSTSLGTLNPEIASSWHPTKNGTLTPFDVSPGSHKEVWWKCDKGDDHEWPAIVNNRTRGSGCAVCVNQIVVPSNSLATVNPNLAKEWHPTKNGSLTPNDITSGSNKNVWWQCNKGHDHVWKTSPSHRKENGCPYCKNPSSGPELRIYCELKAIFSNVLHRTKIDGFEIDILIPDLKIGIEYDGEFWHRNKEEQDLKKNQALAKKINLIRIRDKGLHRLTDNDILQSTRNVRVKTIKLILERILDLRRIKSKEIIDNIDSYLRDNKWINPNQFRKLRAARHHIDFKDSIAFLFPEIAKEWHPTKNNPLKPEYFLPGSNKKVWWKCEKGPDHEWEASIASRCKIKTGCSICSNKKIVPSNSLATLNPELASEWHPTKNKELTPNDVGPGSNKIVWWKCPKGEDHVWRNSITNRSDREQGCSICSNKKIVPSNSLATLDPELASQWHPIKNGDLTPNDVGPGSNKKVWWKCTKGADHEWEATINSRTQGTGCSVCSNLKVVNSNCLATLFPELIEEWNTEKNGNLTPYMVVPGSKKKVWWINKYGQSWDETIYSRVQSFKKFKKKNQLNLFK